MVRTFSPLVFMQCGGNYVWCLRLDELNRMDNIFRDDLLRSPNQLQAWLLRKIATDGKVKRYNVRYFHTDLHSNGLLYFAVLVRRIRNISLLALLSVFLANKLVLYALAIRSKLPLNGTAFRYGADFAHWRQIWEGSETQAKDIFYRPLSQSCSDRAADHILYPSFPGRGWFCWYLVYIILPGFLAAQYAAIVDCNNLVTMPHSPKVQANGKVRF